MNESSLKTIKTLVRAATALSFALFTAFQIYMMIQSDANRIVRLIGVVFYLSLTAASVFSLIYQRGVRLLRSVLLVVGLLGLFLLRLPNASVLFEGFDASDMPTLLTAVAYVASQLGTLLLMIYYLAVRTKNDLKNKRRVTRIMMSVVIVLFVVCLIADCVLRIKYSAGIEGGLTLSLISRVLFFGGFAGTAVGFMLPSAREITISEEMLKQRGADVVLRTSQKDKPHFYRDKKTSPVTEDTDLVFSDTENVTSRSKLYKYQ